MGEQVSKALISLLEEMTQVETMEMKVQGVLFTRRCTDIIKEKVSFLDSLLQKEASNCSQKIDKFYVTKNYIVSSYKEKLEKLYREYYLQYINIQDELLDARLKQRVSIIKYQELINKKEEQLKNPEYVKYMNTKKMLLQKLNLTNNSAEYNKIYKMILSLKPPVIDVEEKKQYLKDEKDKYQKIINLCNQKFLTCKANFEHQVNNEFLIATSLVTSESQGIFSKIKNIFYNIFMGAQKYTDILENYKNIIEKIDCEKILNQMREDTIDFVEQVLIIKEDFVDAIAG